MKRIPYGISNFKKIVEENYYYIDKTEYIEKLENSNEPYLIFLRPRRFGKSLFISKLEYYYDRKWKNEFKDIFGNYYIGKNPTNKHNTYSVLTFSFAGINTDTEENTISGFNGNIVAGIIQFLNKYKIKLAIDENKTAAEIMALFFSKITEFIDSKIYILIDEYDHFANELLGFNLDFFKDSVSKNGFVRKFYETIKEATRTGIVDRIFITGVSPITLDSMTSGFNIAFNITRIASFNEMMGFTQEEVIKLSENTVGENFDVKNNIERLKNYYNGYIFHIKGKNRLYNSDMILYYMSSIQQTGEEPEDLIDRNVLSDYNKIGKLFEIGGNDERKNEILKDIIKGKEQSVKITDRFNLENEFEIDDFKSLLFYMGFLTIKNVDEYGEIYIDIPNYVVKELYFKYFRTRIEKESSYKIDNTDIRDAIKEIASLGTITKLVKLTEETLHRLSGRDFLKFDEKYLQVIMLTYLFESDLYYAKSEYEVADGFIDIVLKKGIVGNPKYYAMLELKYIANKDYSGAKLAEKTEEAREQLKKYTLSDELKYIPNMKKWIVVFCGEKCKLIEEVE